MTMQIQFKVKATTPKTSRTPTMLRPSLLVLSMVAMHAHASTVRDDIDYQYFRDFAENKGQFVAGATNLTINDRDGNELGAVLDAPMPDFAVISRRDGVATLVDTQYLASVQHNQGYKAVQFGDHSSENPDAHYFDYKIVERNLNLPANQTPATTHKGDYHAPRLHKLVTEIAPIASTDHEARPLTDGKRYTAMARAGSGVQNTINKNFKKNNLTHAYQYLTGGTALPKDREWYGSLLYTKGNKTLFDNPMNTALESGDSGSGLLVWDTQKQQWLYGGSAQSASDGFNVYIAKGKYIADKTKADHIGTIESQNSQLTWTANGNTSNINYDDKAIAVPLFDENASNNFNQKAHPDNQQLHHGKSFTIAGDGNTLHLTNNINQGAGAIYFNGNTTVTANNNATWQGAGVVVADGKTVNWQINNPQGDRLSKLGKGTLKVTGTGKNTGDISVGDGVVILNQQADKDGNKQAFDSLGIVSGRGTVVVGDNTQMDWDKLYFGFRGGRLDVNGNELTFNRIANVDEGSQIVNRKDSQATVIIKGNKNTANSADKLTAFNGVLGENDLTKGTNGKLNVDFNPHDQNATLLLTGSANLDGTLSAHGGTLVLSGRPTPHAYDFLKKQEVVKDDDWQNRQFVATTYQADNAHLVIGRNMANVKGNFVLNNATAKLGFSQNDSVCVRSDRTGQVACDSKVLDDAIFKALPATAIDGNLSLSNHAHAHIGSKAHLIGKAVAIDDSQLTLHSGANWTLTDDSSVAKLTLDNGTLTLNDKFNTPNGTIKPHTLTLDHLMGAGQINFLTDINAKQGDKVVAQNATGDFALFVKDTGVEPTHADRLSLLNVKNKGELSVKLANEGEVVDKGAYQYRLIDDNGDYRLYNPLMEQKIRAEKEAERLEKEKQAEIERQRLEAERQKQIELGKQKSEQARIEIERLERERLEKQQTQAQLISRHSNTAVIDTILVQELLSHSGTALTRHLVEAPATHQVWTAGERQLHQQTSTLHRGYTANSNLVQVGIDTPIDTHTQFGVALTNARTQADFERGTDNIALHAVSAYAKYHTPQTFLAVDTALGNATSTLDFAGKQDIKHPYAQLGATVGANLTTNGVSVKPYIGTRLYYTLSHSYKLDGATIEHDATRHHDRFGGVRVSKSFGVGALTLTPSFATHLRQSYGDTTITVNGHSLQHDKGQVWTHELGLGANLGNASLNLALAQHNAKDSTSDTKALASIAYRW